MTTPSGTDRLAVSGHLNIHVAEAGFQCLFAMTVPAVVGVLVAKIVLAVTKLFIRFALKPSIHKGYDHTPILRLLRLFHRYFTVRYAQGNYILTCYLK